MPFDSTDAVSAFILPAHAGAWWRGHEAELHDALLVANRAAPHLAHLSQMLLPRLPRRVLASSSIKGMAEHASSRIVPLAEALTHQWVAFNGRGFVNTETADIDEPLQWRTTLSDMVERHGMPMPAAVVASPWKGTVHLIWVYETPVSNRSSAESRLRRGIRRGLVMSGSCSRFANRLQKNPWHVASSPQLPDAAEQCGDPAIWNRYRAERSGLTYHTEVLQLGTVRARDLFLPLAARATEQKITLLEPKPDRVAVRHIPLGVQDGTSDRKGSRLFHAAARAVRRACTGDAGQIHDLVTRTAAALSSPATPGEVAKIAEAITAWMNSRWRGPLNGRPRVRHRSGSRPINEGVMRGEAADRGPQGLTAWRSLSLQQKRQAAAARTNAERVRRSDDAVRDAVAALIREGEDVTQATVAGKAGVSLSTVQRRWRSLQIVQDAPAETTSHGLIRLCAASPARTESIFHTTAARSVRDLAREIRTSRAEDRRTDRKAIRQYRAQAARLRRRGALDEVVAPLRPGARASVRSAHADVLKAQHDVWRRVAGRQQRERQLRAAEERAAWHAAHVGDELAWTKRLSDLGRRRDEAVQAARARGMSTTRIEDMFGSMFAAEYRAYWRARGEPERVVREDRRPRRRSSPAPMPPGKRARQRETRPAPTAANPSYVMPAFMRRMPPPPAGARAGSAASAIAISAGGAVLPVPG
ncbi:MAG: hypothetical protein DI532_23335 [Azospirillum brasilense]|nr:MAG: hypothetical protein DI532_23335 [Azospirillum brasilense]